MSPNLCAPSASGPSATPPSLTTARATSERATCASPTSSSVRARKKPSRPSFALSGFPPTRPRRPGSSPRHRPSAAGGRNPTFICSFDCCKPASRPCVASGTGTMPPTGSSPPGWARGACPCFLWRIWPAVSGTCWRGRPAPPASAASVPPCATSGLAGFASGSTPPAPALKQQAPGGWLGGVHRPVRAHLFQLGLIRQVEVLRLQSRPLAMPAALDLRRSVLSPAILADGMRKAQANVMLQHKGLGKNAHSRKLNPVSVRQGDRRVRALPGVQPMQRPGVEAIVVPHGPREVRVLVVGRLLGGNEDKLLKVHRVVTRPPYLREALRQRAVGRRRQSDFVGIVVHEPIARQLLRPLLFATQDTGQVEIAFPWQGLHAQQAASQVAARNLHGPVRGLVVDQVYLCALAHQMIQGRPDHQLFIVGSDQGDNPHSGFLSLASQRFPDRRTCVFL